MIARTSRPGRTIGRLDRAPASAPFPAGAWPPPLAPAFSGRPVDLEAEFPDALPQRRGGPLDGLPQLAIEPRDALQPGPGRLIVRVSLEIAGDALGRHAGARLLVRRTAQVDAGLAIERRRGRGVAPVQRRLPLVEAATLREDLVLLHHCPRDGGDVDLGSAGTKPRPEVAMVGRPTAELRVRRHPAVPGSTATPHTIPTVSHPTRSRVDRDGAAHGPGCD